MFQSLLCQLCGKSRPYGQDESAGIILQCLLQGSVCLVNQIESFFQEGQALAVCLVEDYFACDGYLVGKPHLDQIGNAEIEFDGHIPLRTGDSMFEHIGNQWFRGQGKNVGIWYVSYGAERNRRAGVVSLIECGQPSGEADFLAQGVGDAADVIVTVFVYAHAFVQVFLEFRMLAHVQVQYVLGEMVVRKIALHILLQQFVFFQGVYMFF